MDCVRARVLSNRAETESVHRMMLLYDASARSARAARFVTLRFDGPTSHIVPRPFSISDAYEEAGDPITEFLYKPLGRFTTALARLEAGSSLHVLGLLGNGYPLPPEGAAPVLLAGGIGNAPFAFQVRELLDSGVPARRIHLVLAGRREADIYIQPWVREAGVCITEVTEDGSRGVRGRITEVLDAVTAGAGMPVLYACGPAPMLRAVAAWAGPRGLPCHLAVEERMACGYGVCNACVVEAALSGVPRGRGPYLKACVEGPVFAATRIHV
jgi:dihydroorotate dehydrogenase electron transfer subunit